MFVLSENVRGMCAFVCVCVRVYACLHAFGCVTVLVFGCVTVLACM